MLKRVSIYWVLLVALALTSAVPIVVIAFLEVSSAKSEFEEQARQTLAAETRNQARAYNNELQEFRLTTDIAATQAQKLLTKSPGTRISNQEVDNRLLKYSWLEFEYDDGTTEPYFGLDEWFYDEYEPRAKDNGVSNAFIEFDADIENDAGLRYTLAVTERLDSLFGALATSLDRSDVIQRHNIYLITTDGMYRIYPYLDADYAPYAPFTELTEYVAAGPESNPDRLQVWSPPIIDPAFEADVFVSNSIPIYGVVLDAPLNRGAGTPSNGGENGGLPNGASPNGNPPNNAPPSGEPNGSSPPDQLIQGDELYLGVMVHDLDLSALEERTNQFSVGDKGQGFIIDAEGFIIIHQDYKPTEIWRNLSDEAKEDFFLTDNVDEWYAQNGLDVEVVDYYPDIESHLADILDLESDEGMFSIQIDGEEWVVAYDYIPETDWYFIAIQPHAELIETATKVSGRVQQAGLIMIGIVLAASMLLASRITRPVTKLSETARQIEDHVDDETANLINDDLRQLGDIASMREIDNLARVFKQMVFALNNRMVELNSVYAMGQTITSTIDYEATMQAILNAVREVVQCDAAEIVIKRGHMLVAEAWAGDEMVFQIETESAEVKSLLAIPLTRNEKLVGALILAHRTTGHFTEDMKRQLVKLSPQASIAIENAVQVKIREDALKRQITELKVAVDKDTRATQVGEISESDFFKDLQKNAAKLRQQRQTKNQDTPTEDDTSADDKSQE